MTASATDRLGTYRLAQEVRRHAIARPDHPALSDGRTTRTYAELDVRTNRIAHAILSQGLTAGERVAVLDKNSAEVIEVMVGAAKAGVVAVPVNWRLAPAETLAILRDADARLVIVHGEFADLLDDPVKSGEMTRVIIGADYEDWLASQDTADPGYRGCADDPILQIYTSGTTGVPKGVVGTNRNLAATTMCGASWGLDSDAVSLTAMPLFHVGGLSLVLITLAAGGHNILSREVVAGKLLDTIERHRVTATFLVPTVIAALLAEPDVQRRDLTAMRSLIYGASPITPALLRRAVQIFGCPLFQVYGLTETHGAICQLDAGDHDPGGPREHLMRSAGRPYPWVELRTVDLSNGDPTAPGVPGEIQVRGPNVTAGYHNRPDETAAAIDADGWLHTGDIGNLDADGYLTISDRLKEMIITGGENVYPTEVEAILAEHPAVEMVAVIGIPDERWGESVRAVVLPRAGSVCDADELKRYARERLAAYKCPKRIDLVNSMPIGPTGKLLKKEIRDAIVANRGQGT